MPKGSNYLQKNCNELFAESLELVYSESKEVVLLGDLNVDYLKRNENKDIKSIISDNGFTQVIKRATRTTKDTKSLIDIIATNRLELISASIVFQSSDHDLVGCTRKINHQKHAPKTINCSDYKSYDPTSMNREFENPRYLCTRCTLKSNSISSKIFSGNPQIVFIVEQSRNKTFKFQYESKVFIKNFLTTLKRKKATGTDEIPPGILKDWEFLKTVNSLLTRYTTS